MPEAPKDRFASLGLSLDAPFRQAVPLTPASGLVDTTRAVYVNVPGVYTLRFADGDAPVAVRLAEGFHPFRVKEMTASAPDLSGTTLAAVLGLY